MTDRLRTRLVDYGDLGLLLIYAFRYALGRRSTAPSDVQAMIRIHIPVLSRADRVMIADEIDQSPGLGSLIDAAGWVALARWLREDPGGSS